jgi:hypothetical protein
MSLAIVPPSCLECTRQSCNAHWLGVGYSYQNPGERQSCTRQVALRRVVSSRQRVERVIPV